MALHCRILKKKVLKLMCKTELKIILFFILAGASDIGYLSWANIKSI